MSRRYKGAIISATPPTTTGGDSGTAPGVWSLQSQKQAQAAGLWPSQPPLPYIEDVFSPYLYTGTGAALTITNGIDLSTKGGLVWMKGRSGATDHALYDTARGATFDIGSNLTTAQTTQATGLTAFGSTGFTIGALAKINTSSATYASWTFRKQAKFFDIVTYTGTGSNTTIAHNLGSVPGMIIVKRTDTTGAWQVYHRSLANTQYLVLNTTAAVATGATRWNSTTPTSSVFSLGTDATVNASGGTYVAYLFAHDAGGFGTNLTDNVISCGSWTMDGSGLGSVTLGWEPQLIIDFAVAGEFQWTITDTSRSMTTTDGGYDSRLYINSANAEQNTAKRFSINATGFTNSNFGAGLTYVYIAIRRGPMKVPTVGTSVYEMNNLLGITVNTERSIGIVPDMALHVHNSGGRYVVNRLTGGINTAETSAAGRRGWLTTSDSTIEDTTTTGLYYKFFNKSFFVAGNGADPGSGMALSHFFKRAPGFFEVVCYTGTGANTTQTHTLAAVPELMIVKGRAGATAWQVYSSALANTQYVVLNTTAAVATGATRWNSTTPTSSVFSLGTASEVNNSAATYVAYLFATCAGVSKVGSYTGTGTTQTINCGFTAGARFVLIKRTDSTGDWYVWDTVRGIIAGDDPYLLLNSAAAQVTSTDYIDTAATGFEISSTAPAAINANGGTFIFLAIA